jgi:hypothetical protein
MIHCPNHMNARDMLSYLQREHDQIVRALDDPNLMLVGEHREGATIDIQRLRKESEYAFTMAEMKTFVADLYVKLVEVNSQIILFFNAQTVEAGGAAE